MKQFFFAILVFLCQGVAAQVEKAIPNPPSPPRLVNDFTNTLTELQIQALENKLVRYDDTTSNQVVVAIVDNLGGYSDYEYATALGRKWGVGNQEFNNGVVLLVAVGERKVFIAPGYGLEGALPDLLCKQIIEYEILPNFRGNDYFAGIDRGTTAIAKAAAGEYTPPKGYANRGDKGGGVPVLLIIIIVIVLVVFLSGGRGGGGTMSRRGYSDTSVPPIMWFPGGGGGSRGGGFGGGGGGFGGFGGGGFGGGGAGGSW